jgi:predicted O-methyltransferase YrrM
MTVERALSVDGFMTRAELEWLAFEAGKRVDVVEVGSWKGRSTLALSACQGTVFAVDHWIGQWGPDAPFEGDVFSVFRRNVAAEIEAGKVLPVPGQSDAVAVDVVCGLAGGQVDMVFIDAEHSYEAVRADIALWRPLVRSGGMLCGHDYSGDWPGVVRAVNESVPGFQVGDGTSIWWVIV